MTLLVFTLLASLGAAATPDPHASSASLVDLAQAVPRAVLDLHYATADNFLHRAVYAHARCLLRADVAEAIGRVEARVEKAGYRLELWDCYRPLSVQKEMWKLVPQRGLVADPNKGGSHHNRGTAVDASLVDLEGRAVPMPSAHDDFTPAGRRDTPGLPPDVVKRRSVLRSAMEAEGFTTIRTEWWHFDAAGADHAPLLDDPL
jgi:D-alanyl-D-alanine dipeptidase